MRKWNLQKGDPLSLVIAADARITPPDYLNDHIWELLPGGGEPQALQLQSTFGLRARSIRIFPCFSMGERSISNPDEFAKPPTFHTIYPNFIGLEFSPFPGIDVSAEYWVPQSNAITCRLLITNSQNSNLNIQLDWTGILIPTNGEPYSVKRLSSTNILAGKIDGLSPILFLTNGPKEGTGSYPSMSLNISISPNETHKSIMVHAARSETEESFSLARNIAARNWEAEKTKIEMTNQDRMEISTGDPDWDAAIMHSINLTYRSLFGPSNVLSQGSFVFNRLPDQGFSIRGDGSDYDHQWNGQTPLDAYYISDTLLPASPHLIEGILRNFLNSQEKTGFIDWKPGLAGQKSQLLATPILASLTWKIYEYTQDTSFLEDCFPSLLKFIDCWLSSDHDSDRDGIPEWDHLLQTGYDSHPVYSNWTPASPGIDIDTSESPALASLLFNECRSIKEIASKINKPEVVPFIENKMANLVLALEESWDDKNGIYLDRDCDSHISSRGDLLGQREGPGLIFIDKEFDNPVRVFISIETENTTALKPTISIHGKGTTGNNRIERLKSDQINWNFGIGRLTGRKLYSTILHIEINGINPEDKVIIQGARYDCINQTLLLPLWAGIPDTKTADKIITQTILNPNRFWQSYGITECIEDHFSENLSSCSQVNLLWNFLIAEGLIRYDRHDIAARLVSKLMGAIVQNLKLENRFHRYYHSDTMVGIGERDAITGVVPVGLFLRSLGIRIFSNTKVLVEGSNHYPWPVRIQFRGLEIERRSTQTIINFPDGQSVSINDPSPRLISMNEILA